MHFAAIVLGKAPQLLTTPTIPGKVELVKYEPNNVVLNCKTTTEAFLYASEAFYPGWRAYVDGRRTEIFRANLAFRAVKVPPGDHTVLFRFIPISFYAGLVLTAIGFVLLGLLMVRGRR